MVASTAKATSRAAKKTASESKKPMDALRLLKADHREVEGYFKEYEGLDDKREKQALAEKICAALTVHATIEEEIFYPAARDGIDDDDLIDEAEVEHATAKQLIAEIKSMKAGDDLFDAKVKVLGEMIRHHVEEEEEELFPEVESSDMDTDAVGAQMAKRKAELMTQLQQA